jgi:ABC-type lipoprotein export system ATPase subunit
LRKVVKTYESAAGVFVALKDIDLEIDEGEFVAVIGKSGSGKSTLINMITGIDRPTSGEIYVNGAAIHELEEGPMAVWRGKTVGVIFQFFQLLPMLTCVENVMLPMDFCNMYTTDLRYQRALDLLDQVELADQADKLPSEMSGGQQQRAAIARALANDPPILVADEPTGNLDSKTAETVFALFHRLVEQGKTILMVTHDTDLAQRATRTCILSDGAIIEEYLARTFPKLSEAQLIWVTRELERQQFALGAMILAEGSPADRFYIITKGQVDVLLHGGHDEVVVVTTLGQGQYFGEIELVRGGHNLATIRAARDGGVEAASLDRAAFAKLVGESAPLREEIDRVVCERMAENIAGRRKVVAH